MGLTKPVVPVDALPVDGVVLSRILKLVSPEMILVGGQALAFWMLRFGIGGRRGGTGMLVSGVTTDPCQRERHDAGAAPDIDRAAALLQLLRHRRHGRQPGAYQAVFVHRAVHAF